jgi:hypothetical protein
VRRCAANFFPVPACAPSLTSRLKGDYPYDAATGQCHADPKKPVCGTCSGHTDVATNEAALQIAASGGVISIAIAAEQDFMFYSSGVFDSTTCPTNPDSLNHGQLHRLPTKNLNHTFSRCCCRRLRLLRRVLDRSQLLGPELGREGLHPHEDGQELVRSE